ncbi:MAG: DUF4390 domain-containing protein [Syntrophaceae bacterium]|mgnify:CR=1 FL=1|jgi:hypothetical protein|nr:DUF4390 domain-containing protein [Syntrophaceae bacterium]HOC59117.1 DUF4390 domain-containing protein [Smithellaceae bacterium]HQM44603.1 DUF4390 domain-containing protein [Smithellaceae bacterium]
MAMVDVTKNAGRFCLTTGIGLTVLLIVFLAVSKVARANDDPRMVDLLITGNTEKVLLYARLVNCFTPEMEKAIMAGVPAVFTIQMDVYQKRPFLWDSKILGKEIFRTIKYDNLKKTFSITTSGDDQQSVFPDFLSAQKAMADLNGIPVASLVSLSKGYEYYANVRVKMDKVRLPFKMEYVLFFVSLWDFETPLYKIRFSY